MLTALTTPLGPLPVWVWGVAGALALWLFKRYRGGDGALSSALSPSSAAINQEDLDKNGEEGTLDNDSWGMGAVSSLVAAGIDPLQAQYAIGQYLEGGDIDPSSASLISQALRNNGLPPEAVQLGSKPPVLPSPNQPNGTPATNTPKPATPKPSTPTSKPPTKDTKKPTPTSQYITYKIKSGDTLSEVAQKYKVSGGYKKLAEINKIANPNKIYAGQTIKIPK